MRKFLSSLCCLAIIILMPLASKAQSQQELFNPSGLEMPRFVSLKAGKVFARKGPGKNFPIAWIYQRKGLPVEVVQEFDVWRKIRDHEGAESWVHQSLLSGKRTGLALADPYSKFFKKQDQGSDLAALIEHGGIVELVACVKEWCKGESANYRGWLQKKDLWGIYESEEFR